MIYLCNNVFSEYSLLFYLKIVNINPLLFVYNLLNIIFSIVIISIQSINFGFVIFLIILKTDVIYLIIIVSDCLE